MSQLELILDLNRLDCDHIDPQLIDTCSSTELVLLTKLK